MTDPADLAAFGAAVADARPLPASGRVHLGGPMPPPRPLQHLADERAALHESLHGPLSLQDRLEGGDEPSFLRPGLAPGVLRDLRRGRWVIQDEIDLHGLNREEARTLLATFLAGSLKHGVRCVRIVHGDYRETFVAERHASLQSNGYALDDVRERIKKLQSNGTREIMSAWRAGTRPAISLGHDDLYTCRESQSFCMHQ